MKWLTIVLAAAGCASTLPVSRAPLDPAGRQAQLCIADGALHAGQALRIERTICTQDAKSDRVACSVALVGTGRVLSAAGARCAVVDIVASEQPARGDRISVIDAPPRSSTALASRAQ
jgi:hypothetical protein